MTQDQNNLTIGSPAWINEKYKNRHTSVRQALRRFAYDHLTGQFQITSGQVANLAFTMADQIPDCTELTLGLHQLWAAKNYFVMGEVVLRDEFGDEE